MNLTEKQKRYVKQRMDDLSVGHGMVKVEGPNNLIDGVEERALVRLAFRFYKALYAGENFAVPEGSREWYWCFHCPDKCEEYRRLAAEARSEADPYLDLPAHCPKGDDYMPVLTCTRCGAQYEFLSLREGADFLPICPACDALVGDEVRMLRELIS